MAYATLFLLWSLRISRPWLPVISALLIVGVFNQRDAFFMLYPAFLGLWVLRDYAGDKHDAIGKLSPRIDLLLFTFLFSALGFLPLTKGSLLAPALGTAISLAWILHRRKRPIHAGLALVIPTIACCVAWLLAGQPISGFLAYFGAMSSIVSGYTTSMSSTGLGQDILLYLAAASAVLAADLLFHRDLRKDTLAVRMLILSLFLFMGFKAGFVRHDGHAVIAGNVVALAALLTLMFSSRFSLVAISLAIVAWMIIDAQYWNTGTERIVGNLRALWTNTYSGAQERINNPHPFVVTFDERLKELRAKCDLPEVHGTTDIYSYGQACIIANGIPWSPRPVFQSYSAYTADLAQINAEHLASPQAPQNVLFKIEPIDGRLPSLEDGLSWPRLIGFYDLRKFEKGFAVFEKKATVPPATDYAVIATGQGRLGEALELPSPKVTYAKIHVTPTILGRLLGIAFKLPEVRIDMTTAAGITKSYRFIPEMANVPFLVSPLVDTTEDFLLFAEQKASFHASARVSNLRLSSPQFGGSLFWSQSFTYTFFELDAGASNSVSQNLFDQPVAISSKSIADWKPETCDGSLDSLNGTSPVPMEIKSAGNLAVDGWLAVSAEKGIPTESVFIALKESNKAPIVYSAKQKDRSDVGRHFKQPALNQSGYKAYIDTQSLSDTVSLGVVRMYKGEAVLCGPLRRVELKRE